jgi:hypothetical protein
MFDQGWEGEWGGAGLLAQRLWARSALMVQTDQHDGLVKGVAIDTDAAWTIATEMLSARLSLLGEDLTPFQTTPPVPRAFRAPARTKQPPVRFVPNGRRSLVEFAHAA